MILFVGHPLKLILTASETPLGPSRLEPRCIQIFSPLNSTSIGANPTKRYELVPIM